MADSILLTGDRILLTPTSGEAITIDITLLGSGALFRDGRAVCVVGDDAAGKLTAVMLKSEADAGGKLPAKPLIAPPALTGKGRYRTATYDTPGEGTLVITSPFTTIAKAAAPIDGKTPLLTGCKFTAKFTVEKAAQKSKPVDPKKPEVDPAKEYSGAGVFEAVSAELTKDDAIHQTDKKEFLLAGDEAIFPEPEFVSAKGNKAMVMVEKGKGALKGSAGIQRDGRNLCLEEDGQKLTAIPGCSYCLDGYALGGKGTVKLKLDATTSGILLDGKPILLVGRKFDATFEVTEPAKKTPEDKIGDPNRIYTSKGAFAIVRKLP